jgi:hypothetical protein
LVQAIATFKKAASTYHPICRKMVAQDLGLTDAANEAKEAPDGRGKEDLGGIQPAPSNALLIGICVGAIVVTAFLALRLRKR